MKKLVVVLLAVSGLAGCVAYPVGGGYEHRGYRGYDGAGYRGDRDSDGVPNRYDRRPDNPRRY